MGEDKITLCSVGITGTICLPNNAKLVPIFRFNHGIGLVNLSNATILQIRDQRFLEMYKILKVESRSDGLCIACEGKFILAGTTVLWS